ncbi:hypothetical protein DFP72DRAFT_847168 [Ephemerocybe angulata]|uniref:Uncharacterized protein n=1 Tax=Ephemerocybe angulata TaxID=980116 RepID=A0A8H6HZ52_9AGAR|nr:hypothetical protein DFP72DRAFT_847168 [Tulosesus angulatus]
MTIGAGEWSIRLVVPTSSTLYSLTIPKDSHDPSLITLEPLVKGYFGFSSLVLAFGLDRGAGVVTDDNTQLCFTRHKWSDDLPRLVGNPHTSKSTIAEYEATEPDLQAAKRLLYDQFSGRLFIFDSELSTILTLVNSPPTKTPVSPPKDQKSAEIPPADQDNIPQVKSAEPAPSIQPATQTTDDLGCQSKDENSLTPTVRSSARNSHIELLRRGHYIGPVKGASERVKLGRTRTILPVSSSPGQLVEWSQSGFLDKKRRSDDILGRFHALQIPRIEKGQFSHVVPPSPVNAQSPDPVPQPTNFDIQSLDHSHNFMQSADTIWVVEIATAPSTVELSTGGAKKSFDVPAGVSKLSIPIRAGGFIKGAIERGGSTVLELAPGPEQFTFQVKPKSYNFNAFVASAITN